jgi:transcriptional regulator with AAA-type ATPase domain
MVFEAVNGAATDILPLATFKDAIGEAKEARRKQGERPGDFVAEGGPEIVFPNPLPSASELTELLFDEALKRAGGNQSVAARLLGVSPQAVSKRLKLRGPRTTT